MPSVRVLVVCAACLAPCCAVAAPWQPAGDGPAEAAARLPRAAEFVLVVNDASGIRASTPWRALEQALGRFAPLAHVRKNPSAEWAALARALGWSEDETFDRLLGRRVALLVTPSGAGGGGASWALVCDVAADTDRRLRERLRAAPRGVVGGRQVLAVENGNYELATRPASPAAGAARGRPERATVILGPSGRPELFDRLLAGEAVAAGESLEGSAALAAARRLGRADVLALARVDEGDSGAQPWDDFVVVACRRNGSAWTADLVVHQRHSAPALRRVPQSSDGLFQRLADGSLLAVVETRVPDAEGEASALESLLGALGFPGPMQAVLGDRQALVVRPAPAAPGVAAAVALDTRDVPAMTRMADQFVAGAVDSIERTLRGGRGGGEPPAPVPDFHAMSPGAVRVLPMVLHDGPAAAFFKGAGPMVAWSTRGAQTRPGGPEPADNAGWGWWVLAVSPAAADDDPTAPVLVRSVAAAVGAEGGGERRGWITRGVMRPAALESALDRSVPDLGSWRGLFGRFESIGWSVWATEQGELEGRWEVRLAAPAESPPSPGGR